MAFTKLKEFPKNKAARSIEDLWHVIVDAIDTFTPQKCENYIAATGDHRE